MIEQISKLNILSLISRYRMTKSYNLFDEEMLKTRMTLYFYNRKISRDTVIISLF